MSAQQLSAAEIITHGVRVPRDQAVLAIVITLDDNGTMNDAALSADTGTTPQQAIDAVLDYATMVGRDSQRIVALGNEARDA